MTAVTMTMFSFVVGFAIVVVVVIKMSHSLGLVQVMVVQLLSRLMPMFLFARIMDIRKNCRIIVTRSR